MNRTRTALLAVLAVLGLLAGACSSDSPSATSDDAAASGSGTEFSGTTINVPEDHPTIQEAVDAASPGDLVLIGPGIYNEAVDVETPGLTIRGLDRNAVILDGEFTRDNGVRILGADNVTVQNMTARNYTGNGFYWTGVEGYHGSYLTAYRNGDYGIYAFDSVRGQFDNSYASGSPDAGFYIGQCFPCDAAILDVVSEYNGLGYSGTNSGGNLVIARSEFAYNRAGVVPNSGSYELCYPERDTVIVGNLVHDNGVPTTPAIDVAKLAMGTGILPAGGRDNLIQNNRVWNHERVGIVLAPFPEEEPRDDIPTGDELTMPCSEHRTLPLADEASVPGPLLWDAMGNTVKGNVVSGSGIADLAFGSLTAGDDPLGNCFEGNTFTTSAPAEIETVMACTSPTGAFTGTLDLAGLIAGERPPSGELQDPAAAARAARHARCGHRPGDAGGERAGDHRRRRHPGAGGAVTDLVPAPRRHRGAVVVGLALAVVGALVAGAVLWLGPGGGGEQAAAEGATGFQRGPQGLVPQFVVSCAYSHSAPDDPIVWPGAPGRSHRHDFFGNRRVDAASTPDSMLGGPTSCERQLDTAAYWAPSLFDHGVPVSPLGLDAYYRPGPGIDPASVEPYPHGLMMISGDHTATEAQSTAFVGWGCGIQGDPEVLPPTCSPDTPLRLKVVFPDCWDGERLDSDDHRSHVAASVGGECPDDHPVAIPQLTISIGYPISGEGHDLALASGSVLSGHADFVNAWDEVELTRQVERCLNRALVCGVVSNKAEDVVRPMPTGAA